MEDGSGLSDIYAIPAQGVDDMEQGRYGIHVVNAALGDDFELAKGFGEKDTVRINGAHFNPEYFDNYVNILSGRGTKPVRVVVHNLGMIHHDFVHDFERIMEPKNGYPEVIKNIYFMDTGDQVDPAFFDKVLTCCDDVVDSHTLLDAVAYGWGSKNAYSGQPLDQGEELPGATAGPPDFIPSNVPLSVDSEDRTFSGY